MRIVSIVAGLASLLAPLSLVSCDGQNGQVVFEASSYVNASTIDRQSYPKARKIAIIGAGAGGTSAAYFLSQAQKKLESQGFGAQGVEVTLFERDTRIGGRTAVVYPYHDESLPAIELGASIFADVNKNLQRASRRFDLQTGAKIGEEGVTGVWDGQQFVVEGLDNGWWNSAKMFWRYGYSPLTTQKLVAKLVDAFLQLYDPAFLHRMQSPIANVTQSGFPWTSIDTLAKAMGLHDLAGKVAGDHFYESGVSKLFIEEIIEAATLVNYGQEVYSLHGVGGSVSLAASGATGVVGGNYQIFESMLGACDALRLRLGIHGEVTGLARFKTIDDVIAAGKMTKLEAVTQGLVDKTTGTATEAGQTTRWWLGTKSAYGDMFDAVFIAAPWHSSGITLLNTRETIPSPSYVHLHVTIIVTKAAQPDPAYFGRGEKDAIPNSILTTHAALRRAAEDQRKKQAKHDKGRRSPSKIQQAGRRQNMKWWPWDHNGKQEMRMDFNSLTYLMTLPRREGAQDGSEEHVVKLFSEKSLSDEQLSAIFGEGNVLWIHRKQWDAYPYLTPRSTFPKLQVDRNLYFLNAMETLISTMETATVSARNAVALYLEQEYGADFVHGGKDCPWQGDQATTDDDEGDSHWDQWGCRGA